MSVDTAFRRLRQANPVPEPAGLREQRQASAAFLQTTQQRSEQMQTQDKPTVERGVRPMASRRRWLIPALAAATAIVAAVIVVMASGGDDSSEVAAPDQEQPPVTVLVDGAASLVGTRADITGGLASPLPKAIEFEGDGTYRILLNRGVGDEGTYQVEGDTITFASDAAVPGWQFDPLMGANDPSQSIYANQSCEGVAGEYRVVPQGGPQLRLEVVWDECRVRVAVANRLEMELAAG